jgi:hypothetical protein
MRRPAAELALRRDPQADRVGAGQSLRKMAAGQEDNSHRGLIANDARYGYGGELVKVAAELKRQQSRTRRRAPILKA